MSHRPMSHRIIVAAFVGLVAATPAAAMSAKKFMKAVNADADKTISKDELDAYAKKRFGELEADKDKSVDEAEFTGYAETLFDQADTEHDKTLTKKELASPAGKKLIKLLQ